MLAGVATGVFSSHEDAVSRCVRVIEDTAPVPEGVACYAEGFRVYQEIQRALAPIYHRL